MSKVTNNENMRRYVHMHLSSGSGSGSGSEGGEGGDIQIVELTYDHLPATGTLSASDLAKLDSDNCLLVLNGKYFRKTFNSDGGIDYKEIGLTTVLGGVRSIYFTASKPDGEYTIAYTYPVEANTQTQPTTALGNIKVGNTTYSVPPSPMVVEGTVDLSGSNALFTPAEGQPTWAEAFAHMSHGGILYLNAPIPPEGNPAYILALVASYSDGVIMGHKNILWANFEMGGGGNNEGGSNNPGQNI